MALFTVTTDDGTEVQVSASDLPDGATYAAPGEEPDGFISEKKHEAEMNDAIEDAVQDRLKNHVRKDEAAQNQEVINTVLEEHGEDIDLDAKKQQWRQEWEEEELSPTKDKLQSRTDRMKELALLTKAREHGVDEQWVEDPKMRQVFLSDVKDRVEYDPEHGDDFGLVALGEDGESRLSGGKDAAYGGTDTLFSTMREEDENASYFGEPNPQGGGGANPGGTGGSASYEEKPAEERAQQLNASTSTDIPGT